MTEPSDPRLHSSRVLGLDVGSKTIGVAVTDELGAMAHAVTVLARRGTAADVLQVEKVADTYQTRRTVVGIPYDAEGKEGHRAARVRVFIDALVKAGFSCELYDESFSTVEAVDVLLEADLSRQKRKKVVDRAAAQVILQRWLDASRRDS